MPAAARKVALTDRSMKALKPPTDGRRTTVWDALMPGMAVRVSGKGKRAFYAVRRRAGQAQPTWVLLGHYPVVGLTEARAAARGALGALGQGHDPASLAEARRAAERKRDASTFAAVAELFIREHLPKRRTAASYEKLIRRELIPVLGERGIGEICRRDVIALLKAIAARGQPTPDRLRPKSGGKYAARHAFAALSKIYNWAVAQDTEGLDANPVAGLKPSELLGEAEARARVLNDDEIAAVWNAAPPGPFGTLFQVLLLTGQRKNEIARASWGEITDLDGADPTLTVPAERMKGMDGKVAAHTVPLTPTVVEILRGMPRFTGGDFVFTTTAGRRPLGGFSKVEKHLRARAGIAHWQVHDLRRTVRTRLSELGVTPFTAELVIAHRQGGVHAVYDLHTYDREKRQALARWERRLLSIVAPEPESKVVPISGPPPAPEAKQRVEVNRKIMSGTLKSPLLRREK
jgi:integrase